MAQSAVKSPAPEQLLENTEAAKNSRFSSLMGTWAWQKQGGEAVTAKDRTSTDETSEQPKPGHEK
jgi:hypothetical protein